MLQYIDITRIRQIQNPLGQPFILESVYNGRTGLIRELVQLEDLDDDVAWENGRRVLGALDVTDMIQVVRQDHPEFHDNIYLDLTEDKESITGLRLLYPNDPDYPDTLTPLLDTYYRTHHWENRGTLGDFHPEGHTIHHASYDVWDEKVLTNTLLQHREDIQGHPGTIPTPWTHDELVTVPGHLERIILPDRELPALGYPADTPCYLAEDWDSGTVTLVVRDRDGRAHYYDLAPHHARGHRTDGVEW